MTTTRWPLILGLIVGCSGDVAPAQPISFNHKLHLSDALARHVDQARLSCTTCHPGAVTKVGAGLPAASLCLSCHMKQQLGEDQTPSADEELVRSLGGAGKLRWQQRTRNPGHVYFSHRAHTGIGGMECYQCHGDVSQWERSPTKPNFELLSMARCIDCHRKRRVSNECGSCHR